VNKKGLALIFSLLVTLVLAALLAGFFFKGISENQQARRISEEIRAFWLAEAGIAKIKGTAGLSSASGYIDDTNYTYNATISGPLAGTTDCYTIVSTGTVTLPSGEVITRTLTVTLKTMPPDPSKFKFGIETTGSLDKGKATIVPDDNEHGWKEHSVIDFVDLFGISKTELKAMATQVFYSKISSSPINGITWVEGSLTISTPISGSGILVINGDAHFSGQFDFNGIIYIIGKAKLTGQSLLNGSILVESSTEVTSDLSKNVTINYDSTEIADALMLVAPAKRIVSWQE
jgi:hypothetical protein